MTKPSKAAQFSDALRTEFINGSMSLRELSDAHGVSYAALRQHAAKEKWTEQRDKVSQAITAAAVESVAAKRIKELEKFNEDDLQLAKAMRGMVAMQVRDSQTPGGTPLTPADLSRLANVLVTAQKVGRTALGASTENVQHTGQDGAPIAVTNVPMGEWKEAIRQALNDY